MVFAFFSLLPIFSARFAPGRERRPLPAAEAGSCEWLRKRGAASGRNSRAGAGAAVQICKRTACATPIWVTATRSSAPVFASAHQSAPQKSAKRKRGWQRPVTERAISRLRGEPSTRTAERAAKKRPTFPCGKVGRFYVTSSAACGQTLPAGQGGTNYLYSSTRRVRCS